MIEVELPDGTIAEFPDGTPNATIERALRTQSMGPKADFSDVSAKVDPARRQPAKGDWSNYSAFKAPEGTNPIASFLVNRGKDAIGSVDGLQHHLMNIPVGVAQLGGNMLDKGIQSVAGGTDFARNSARVNAENNAQVRQREADYQKRTDGNFGSYGGAVVGEVAPWMLGIGQLRTAGMLPTATTTLGKAGMLAGEGALMGATMPVTGEGSYGAQKALQVGVGTLTGPALLGAGKTIGASGRLAQYVTNPEAVAARRIAKQFGGADPQAAIQQLRQAPQYLPGEMPTAAQVLGGGDNVAAERVLRNSPEGRGVFAEADNANDQARQAVIQRLAGTDDELTAAVQARRDATQPFRQANLPEEGSKLVDSSGVSEQLKKLTFSPNATVRSAASEHLAILKASAKNGKVPAYFLDDLRQEVGGMLAKHAPNGVVGTKEAAKYGPVLSKITDTLDGEVPGYRDYLAAYSAKSEPINTMESIRKLTDPNGVNRLDINGDSSSTAARINQVLRGDDKARYSMSDDARTQLEAVRDSRLRSSVSDNKVAAAGPGTAADLASAGGGPLGDYAKRGAGLLGGGLIGHITGLPGGAELGGLLGYGLKDAASALNGRVTRKVAERASSAQLAADAIEKANQRRMQRRGISLLEPYLLPYETP